MKTRQEEMKKTKVYQAQDLGVSRFLFLLLELFYILDKSLFVNLDSSQYQSI